MAIKEIFRFSCDAPGCEAKKEIEAEQRAQVDVPEGWYDEQVGDTHLIGCNEVHVCAAIVKELGYDKVSEAMMGLQVPKKVEAQPKIDPQSNVATIPIAPPKKDPTEVY